MKKRRFLVAVLLMFAVVFSSGVVFAAPSAYIGYYETDLGGGWWQYDYKFTNNSDAGEYLYSVWLDFTQESEVVGLTLPSGWEGTPWMGTNTTLFLDAHTATDSGVADIAAGNTLGGFSFKVNYQAGSTAYTAYFDDHNGNFSSTSGVTAPEPISSVLFLTGGAVLAFRKRYRAKKQQ